MNTPDKCPKCGGRMEEGFILEHVNACRHVSRWVEGKPEISFFMGARVDGRVQLQIQSFRCVVCGLLESYALG